MCIFARTYVSELVRDMLSVKTEEILNAAGGIESIAKQVAAREVDPYTAAEKILAADIATVEH